jgi:hypothetical protein
MSMARKRGYENEGIMKWVGHTFGKIEDNTKIQTTPVESQCTISYPKSLRRTLNARGFAPKLRPLLSHGTFRVDGPKEAASGMEFMR